MTAWLATTAGPDWIVAVLTERRKPLVAKAPVFWRPAPDPAAQHRAYLEYLLSEGGARAYRTDASVLIAAPRRDGLPVDDAYVPGEDWVNGDGSVLWNALSADFGGVEGPGAAGKTTWCRLDDFVALLAAPWADPHRDGR